MEIMKSKDEEKYKTHPKYLRISNKKSRNNGIRFLNTEDGIQQCIEEFNFEF